MHNDSPHEMLWEEKYGKEQGCGEGQKHKAMSAFKPNTSTEQIKQFREHSILACQALQQQNMSVERREQRVQ